MSFIICMTVRSDEEGRLVCAELFPPNSIFNAERQTDGSVRLKKISEDIPVVEPILTPEGFLMLPIKLDRKKIASAIRADRDAQ
jgi:hypothetical protein